jgi:hypothetical protein
MDNARMIGTIAHRIHVHEELSEVKAFQNKLLAKCLIEHGYQ